MRMPTTPLMTEVLTAYVQVWPADMNVGRPSSLCEVKKLLCSLLSRIPTPPSDAPKP
jgi:hypothetical protein